MWAASVFESRAQVGVRSLGGWSHALVAPNGVKRAGLRSESLDTMPRK